ncbi:hypothetical protein TNCV_1424871 [Trichonephila clavipes]|nr:hypothetical protein TNCV_1424871 [Trichonephila clavipes]
MNRDSSKQNCFNCHKVGPISRRYSEQPRTVRLLEDSNKPVQKFHPPTDQRRLMARAKWARAQRLDHNGGLVSLSTQPQ